MNPVCLTKGLEVIRELNPESQTYLWYRTPIRGLMDLIGDVPVTQVTEAHINAWYLDIEANGYSPWTVDSYCRGMRAYFNKMVSLGHISESPATKCRAPKLPPKRPKDIGADDVERLLAASRYDLRDYCMIRVLYDSGCRVGELVSMRVSNLDLGDDGGRCLVRGKGNQIRWMFVGYETAEALKAYVSTRPINSPDDLWLSKKGGATITARALTKNGVYLMLRRLAQRVGVKRFNPHSFRHAFAKRMIDEGMPMRLVQELMGHSDISVTMTMYANYDEQELEAYYRRYNDDKRKLPSSPLTFSDSVKSR